MALATSHPCNTNSAVIIDPIAAAGIDPPPNGASPSHADGSCQARTAAAPASAARSAHSASGTPRRYGQRSSSVQSEGHAVFRAPYSAMTSPNARWLTACPTVQSVHGVGSL